MVIDVNLDRSDPMPLYHQIVQALRWRIGTGALHAGEQLPTIRDAAQRWGVNYHTVRRAYRELAARGWIQSVQGAGTQVAAAPVADATTSNDLERWLDHVIETGYARFSVSAQNLAMLLQERVRILRVVVVECDEHQCAYLAQQIEEAWSVEAIPWSLDKAEEPPHLPIIGTYFHYSEMRSRWPTRISDMHYVALHLDPGLKSRVETAADLRGAQVLHLVEKDATTAREMAADVAAQLSPHFHIQPVAGDPNTVLRSLPRNELLLVAARLWDRLRPSSQADDRVFDVRHVIIPEDLARVRRLLNRKIRESSKGPSTGTRVPARTGTQRSN